MQLPIINENNDEKNVIIPCKYNLQIYFNGRIGVNGNIINDDRLKFDFGPIKVNHLNGPIYMLPYNDFAREDNGQNLGGIKLFTKHGMCKTDHYEYEITNSQYNDLQSNFVDTIIDILNNDHSIFNYIGENILDRLYSLGWLHHEQFAKFNDNITLNVKNDSDDDKVYYCVKTPYYDCDGEEQIKEEIIILPSQKTTSSDNVSVNSRILMASNIIQQDGRRGPSKYLIIGESNYSALLDNSNFQFEQITNDNTIHIPNIKKAGTIYGKDVYVTKNEKPYILLGRNEETETGLTFLPYYIEPLGYIFKDEKVKIIFNIRYTISDVGFSPELNYFMFYHKNFLND